MIDFGDGERGEFQHDNDFWRFSLAIYSQADVAKECLELQQAIGADVNLLLFSAWAGTQGIVLTAGDIEAASRKVAAWQEHVVRPLRCVRQEMKALEHADTESFRARVKNIEIEAEQIEQAMLFAYSKTIDGSHAGTDCRDAVTQNVKKYLELKSGSRSARGRDFSAPFLIGAALR